ncbi:Ppx/GppA phosphatase family protein [Schaalia suimastitidis]|uniref:Ppx/GppA phosphatase family protein n=1 Tax=Schaalia suimastitidis TaxID=121163 RepID=UPI000401901D|nr:Ppx/GppA phosphatase family protein [Schaalia suimastitidis]
MRVAAIDCGTNSIRLLIAESSPGCTQLIDLSRQMRIVRLGQGVDKTGVLAPEAIERSLAAVREYRALIDQAGVDAIRFVATSAMRDAANRDLFVTPVRDILGVDVEVVPGAEEAALSFAGAISALDTQAKRPVLVVDIGGGSTELVLGCGTVDEAISIDMGSVRVTEKFFADCAHDAGIPAERAAMATQWIDDQLDQAETSVDLTKVATLVGVAGTVTTVTARALGLEQYEPTRIHGAVLHRTQIDLAVADMVNLPVPVKASWGFMPPGRADVIAGGALIWRQVVDRVARRAGEAGRSIETVVTSEHDILDGIALSLLK